MLHELMVSNLGVIEQASLVFGGHMTALTGETGAGKTMLVDAIDLLVGGRATPTLVRPGAAEARVEGRFTPPGDLDGEEIILARVVPREGRSRAYVNGRLATVAELAELGRGLVDLHGQHAHQSLLAPTEQRRCLDAFGKVDLAPLQMAERAIADIDAELADLGGDLKARAREMDLLRYQVTELDAATLTDPEEDKKLRAEAELLGDATELQDAVAVALDALSAEGSAADNIGSAIAALANRAPFTALEERLRNLNAEVSEVAAELRDMVDSLEADPDRLAEINARRNVLKELRRKYGDDLGDVMAFADEVRAQLARLEGAEERAERLEGDRTKALVVKAKAAAQVAAARRQAAPELAAKIQANLAELAMAKARIEIAVSGEAGEHVEILLGANPGEETLPLAKVASGGELARTMLALRLVLSEAPPTLLFDEVDAGIGGSAALAVGRSLARLAANHQILVVTHLAQVAGHADHHVVITKTERDERTVSETRSVVDNDRVLEISRMLSGTPDSSSTQGAARELLDAAAKERSR